MQQTRYATKEKLKGRKIREVPEIEKRRRAQWIEEPKTRREEKKESGEGEREGF